MKLSEPLSRRFSTGQIIRKYIWRCVPSFSERAHARTCICVYTWIYVKRVTSRNDYCSAILTGVPNKLIQWLQIIQNSAARIITRTKSTHQGYITKFYCLPWKPSITWPPPSPSLHPIPSLFLSRSSVRPHIQTPHYGVPEPSAAPHHQDSGTLCRLTSASCQALLDCFNHNSKTHLFRSACPASSHHILSMLLHLILTFWFLTSYLCIVRCPWVLWEAPTNKM